LAEARRLNPDIPESVEAEVIALGDVEMRETSDRTRRPMRGTAGLIGALGITAALSACAAPPESTAQSDVSSISYNSLNCFDLADELERVDAVLTQASQPQEQAQGSDGVGGVPPIGVPASTLSDTDVAPQLASLEGQQQAIHLAMAQKHCRVRVDVKRETLTSPSSGFASPR
jgi:hypothetical protein